MELAEKRRRERAKRQEENGGNNNINKSYTYDDKFLQNRHFDDSYRNVWRERWRIVYRKAFTDMFTRPFSAQSKTISNETSIDFISLGCPVRTFVWCTICPYLCYPIGMCNFYGYLRCLYTMRWVLPKQANLHEPHVLYCVHKRAYNSRNKKLEETIIRSPSEVSHALQVTGSHRNQFIDDPQAPSTAYYITEQKVLATGNTWANTYYFCGIASDYFRYMSPVLAAACFHRSCRRLTTDIRLWWQGRLRLNQLRHPIPNFWEDHQEYHKKKRRVVFTTALPKDYKPWSTNL